MNKLLTPFGFVNITINGDNTDYIFKKLCNEQLYNDGSGYFFNVHGRYKIIPCIDKKTKLSLNVECYINKLENIVFDDKTGAEGGEHMVMQSMYNKNIKLSIGGLDDIPDYSKDSVHGYYLPTGVGVEIVNAKHLEHVYFYLAWVTLTSDDYETNEDIYTWRAADPY